MAAMLKEKDTLEKVLLVSSSIHCVQERFRSFSPDSKTTSNLSALPLRLKRDFSTGNRFKNFVFVTEDKSPRSPLYISSEIKHEATLSQSRNRD